MTININVDKGSSINKAVISVSMMEIKEPIILNLKPVPKSSFALLGFCTNSRIKIFSIPNEDRIVNKPVKLNT